MKNMLKLGIILALYTTAACVGLAFVYTGTKTIIAERARTDLEKALFDLFPQADHFTDTTGSLTSPDTSVTFIETYELLKGDTVVGLAIKASSGSYGGPITILAGVGTDRKIAAVKVLSHKDTPGLGANAASPTYYVDKKTKTTFTGQYSGKSLSDSFTVKKDVIAITASTITSSAVNRAVKAAGKAGETYLTAIQGESK